VLSCLYKKKFSANMSREKLISRVLLLLQHWSWTRFPIARPGHRSACMPLGGDEDSRPPFAIKWRYYKTYKHALAYSSLTYYRNEFENMLLKHVNW
jgi:Plant mobile domain